jgi:adenosylcobinamide-GDP ribazoletransferase
MTEKTDTRLVVPADLLVAGALLTRLPLPHAPSAAFARQARAGWTYPLIGAGLAALAALVWGVAGWLGWPPLVQAGLTLAALTAMTGALHEDGLADSADGLWGGTDPARRLEIMKDSHIGSYGVLALVFITGLRWLSLAAAGPWALLASASLSRAVLPALLHALPLARTTGLARSVGAPPPRTAILALTLGTALAWAATGFWLAVLALATCLSVAALIGTLARRKIGGVTGDICGATQQLTELAVLLALLP